MSVIAKFQVTSIEQFGGGYSKVRMNAVMPSNPGSEDGPDSKVNAHSSYGGDENEAFWQATPSGSLEMTIQNPTAAEQFQPGDAFYLTFERADDYFEKSDAS